MRIIAKKCLRQFWESRKHDAEVAEQDLSRWHKIVRMAEWANFASLRQTFGSADQVGNCVVFNVGNNRFRVIGRVNYDSGTLFTLKVMDHPEYDEKRWPEQCGCHRPPPDRLGEAKSRTTGKSAQRKRGARHER